MNAVVDQNTCIGCTLCLQICPEVYKMEDDKAVSYISPVPESVEKSAREAAKQCPVNAIQIAE